MSLSERLEYLCKLNDATFLELAKEFPYCFNIVLEQEVKADMLASQRFADPPPPDTHTHTHTITPLIPSPFHAQHV